VCVSLCGCVTACNFCILCVTVGSVWYCVCSRYDERFRGYGLNKVCHVMALHQAGYAFKVAPWPDVMVTAREHAASPDYKKTYGASKDPFQSMRVQALFNVAQRELKAKRPSAYATKGETVAAIEMDQSSPLLPLPPAEEWTMMGAFRKTATTSSSTLKLWEGGRRTEESSFAAGMMMMMSGLQQLLIAAMVVVIIIFILVGITGAGSFSLLPELLKDQGFSYSSTVAPLLRR